MDVNLDARGRIWGKWKIDDGLWVLTNRWGNFCYLILGETHALLFDTGTGEGNIRTVVEEITSLPVYVVASHGHWDHTGGIVWWDECYAMADCKEDFYCDVPDEIAKAWESKLNPNFRWNTVQEGFSFDLGGRVMEVLSASAHAKSGMFLLDRANRALFSGDELDPSQVLLTCRPEISIEEDIQIMYEDMRKLMGLLDIISVIYPAHNGVALSPDYIRDYYALIRKIKDGSASYAATTAGFGWPAEPGDDPAYQGSFPADRAEFGLASIIVKRST